MEDQDKGTEEQEEVEGHGFEPLKGHEPLAADEGDDDDVEGHGFEPLKSHEPL